MPARGLCPLRKAGTKGGEGAIERHSVSGVSEDEQRSTRHAVSEYLELYATGNIEGLATTRTASDKC